VTDLSKYRFNTLRREELGLYRGSADDLSHILVVSNASRQPSLELLRRFEHELALRSTLEPEWAARPLELTEYETRMALVLEDPGGEPLTGLLGGPLETSQFLRIAISLASAVARMHERGLIHKDIKPSNVLVETRTYSTWLTGFSIASRQPRERQAPDPPDKISGTLAYMSPEQTGRMNRTIDSRSDLYALGVTFYEMLAGALPFTADDPMAWVHCHIARQPLEPSQRHPAVPLQLSSVVMKLLAKNAEDRYQTADGLVADLRRCLLQWEIHRRVDQFPLGLHDTPNRLVIPERLYGRDAEIGTLLASFDRVALDGRSAFLLVSGYSGVGKSSLVNELHKVLVPRRGLFGTGKFDQYKRSVPYGTLAQAFQSLVHQVLGATAAQMDEWHDALLEALGPNGQLIVNLVPELALVIGNQPPPPELPPQDQQARFQTTVRRFLGVFARPKHPLVLFLDDLQWLDSATADLIEHLIAHPELKYLLLVGAYRENEVKPLHPLLRMLSRLREAGEIVQDIRLDPLPPEEVCQLLADALHSEPGRVAPIAGLVFDKTGGNPFFTVHFITTLANDKLLTFDAAEGAWIWDVSGIRAKGFTDNVADLMAAKLSQLPPDTQKTLGILACLGPAADAATLAALREKEGTAADLVLWEAILAGFVLYSDDTYTFAHDRIRESAYELLPASERATMHLRIGRLLAKRTSPDELQEKIFDIVNQFDHAAGLITTAQEREQIAELHLLAGKRAKTASAYSAALEYFAAGRTLLPQNGWEQCYRLSFDLELNFGECEYLTGEVARSEKRLSALGARACTLVDSAAVACLRINLYTNLDQAENAIGVGVDFLRHVDRNWSASVTDVDVRREYLRLLGQLRPESIEDLIDLPLAIDPEKRATIDVLTELAVPALFTNVDLFRAIVCRIVALSLEHGNTDGSSLAYVRLGAIVSTYIGDYQIGFRFARLGVDLVEKRGLDRYKARVYFVLAAHVAHWTQELTACLAFARRAFDAAQAAGDYVYAAYSFAIIIEHRLALAHPLEDVQREAEQCLQFAQSARVLVICDQIREHLVLIQTLRGATLDRGLLDDDTFADRRFEQDLYSEPPLAFSACAYWFRRLAEGVYSNDTLSAVSASQKLAPLIWTFPTRFDLAQYHFHSALAWAAHSSTVSADNCRDCIAALKTHRGQIAIWARTCPSTFASRATLLDAEIARIEGAHSDATRLYEEAIALARDYGFVQDEAIAHELAARFASSRNLRHEANAHLQHARYCYLQWGAGGKVRQLEQRYLHLSEELISPKADTTIDAPVEQLDLATVVKASQAVAGEILFERLIETLMTIALEHAGAEWGTLILLHDGELRIEATANTRGDAVQVTLQKPPKTAADLPNSILHTVMRTRRGINLEDAVQSSIFTADAYIQRRRPRSVLCLPLLKQGQLIGLLYLENNLAPGVFTKSRAGVTELVLSQAAISLENARLYDGLRRSEALLAEAQRMTQTGSWAWKPFTDEVAWSLEHYRILGLDREKAKPSFELFFAQIHPDDRSAFEETIRSACQARADFEKECRVVLSDGRIRYVHCAGHTVVDTAGNFVEFIGTTRDITERRQAEEALRGAQSELARVTRLSTMGELVASIAHEINQPLGAIVINAGNSIRSLSGEKPDLLKARDAITRIASDSQRAADVIRGLRALVQKNGPNISRVDIKDAIEEVLILTRIERQRHNIELRTALRTGDRLMLGDRVQLQQVILNLIMNGIEAMSTVIDRPRVLEISSEPVEEDHLLVAVHDTGPGLDPQIIGRIFDPFFTTKSSGMGMGLSVCRTIIEAHKGRFWTSPREPHGSSFQFTVPSVAPRSNDATR